MEKKTIYISGKITGTTDYREKFEKAENKLIKAGYEVLNPVEAAYELETFHKVCGKGKPTWQEYMREAIKMEMRADEVYMLSDWQESEGAKIERNLAFDLHIPIRYESKEDKKAYE